MWLIRKGEGNGTPLQYSCLENPMDGGAWWAAVHGVARSRTRLSDFTFTFHFHALQKEMATHSSVLAWRIPGMGEPGGLPSMGSHRVGHDWSDLAAAAAAVQRLVVQSCLTLCNCMDCSLPGSSVHGVLQARILEWVAILSHSFLQGIFLTKGSNPGLQDSRQILSQLSHHRSPFTHTSLQNFFPHSVVCLFILPMICHAKTFKCNYVPFVYFCFYF